MSRREVLPIDELARDAIAGRTQPFEDLLLRRGGLPGPRPNHKLAVAAARALLAQGEAGRRYLDALRGLDERAAPAGSAYPFLTIVGIVALAYPTDEALHGDAVDRLHAHAEDSRREVRDAVRFALQLCLQKRPREVLERVQRWSDGYLHAEVMLRALADPAVTQQLDDIEAPLSRLQESFALAAEAPRSHQRSQGYRSLLKAIGVAIAALGKRFPQPMAQWLESNASVSTKDLLEVLNHALDDLRSSGFRAGDAEGVQAALEAAVPPPRDPRWDVGPTRERGRKARKKGRTRR